MKEVPGRFFKRLQSKKDREIQRLTMAEGPEVVLSALVSGVIIDSIVVADGFLESGKYPRIKRALESQRNAKKYIVPSSLFAKISETKSPRGILAIIPFPFNFYRRRPPKDENTSNLLVACVDVQDPGNIGTVLRTSAAAGADGVLVLGDSADPYSPKCIRASAGSVFLVPLKHSKDAVTNLENLADQGVMLVKAYPRGGVYPWQVNFTKDVCIVLGNEARGLDEFVDSLKGIRVTVPMPGETESLNVAMASGMLIYEAVRQRMV
jgi:TrmH family RNA methyltransferase